MSVINQSNTSVVLSNSNSKPSSSKKKEQKTQSVLSRIGKSSSSCQLKLESRQLFVIEKQAGSFFMRPGLRSVELLGKNVEKTIFSPGLYYFSAKSLKNKVHLVSLAESGTRVSSAISLELNGEVRFEKKSYRSLQDLIRKLNAINARFVQALPKEAVSVLNKNTKNISLRQIKKSCQTLTKNDQALVAIACETKTKGAAKKVWSSQNGKLFIPPSFSQDFDNEEAIKARIKKEGYKQAFQHYLCTYPPENFLPIFHKTNPELFAKQICSYPFRNAFLSFFPRHSNLMTEAIRLLGGVKKAAEILDAEWYKLKNEYPALPGEDYLSWLVDGETPLSAPLYLMLDWSLDHHKWPLSKKVAEHLSYLLLEFPPFEFSRPFSVRDLMALLCKDHPSIAKCSTGWMTDDQLELRLSRPDKELYENFKSRVAVGPVKTPPDWLQAFKSLFHEKQNLFSDYADISLVFPKEDLPSVKLELKKKSSRLKRVKNRMSLKPAKAGLTKQKQSSFSLPNLSTLIHTSKDLNEVIEQVSLRLSKIELARLLELIKKEKPKLGQSIEEHKKSLEKAFETWIPLVSRCPNNEIQEELLKGYEKKGDSYFQHQKNYGLERYQALRQAIKSYEENDGDFFSFLYSLYSKRSGAFSRRRFGSTGSLGLRTYFYGKITSKSYQYFEKLAQKVHRKLLANPKKAKEQGITVDPIGYTKSYQGDAITRVDRGISYGAWTSEKSFRIQPIMAKLTKDFDRLMQSTQISKSSSSSSSSSSSNAPRQRDEESYFQDLAEFYWVFVNAGFMRRGTSQLALETLYFMMEKQGYRMPPVKSSCYLMDCVALCLPLDEFKKNFLSYFEYPPTKL